MGSFTSAPKIINGDHQDDDVSFDAVAASRQAILELCRAELAQLPAIIRRDFLAVPRADADADATADAAADDAVRLRIMQWNILSQCESIK